jgi:hypothetical protein
MTFRLICQQCGEPVFEERVVEEIQHLLMRFDESMERICPEKDTTSERGGW